MTEAEWLLSHDPQAMLNWAQTARAETRPGGQQCRPNLEISDRKLRLFAIACAMRAGQREADVEKVADEHEARLGAIASWARRWCEHNHGTVGATVPQAYKAALLREVCGNPFRPVALPPFLCSRFHGDEVRSTIVLSRPHAYATDTVLSLATAAYEERIETPQTHKARKGPISGGGEGEGQADAPVAVCGVLDPARLLVLADALEEAGCDSEAMLLHLRGWWPTAYGANLKTPLYHVRGCWALDLILGKN